MTSQQWARLPGQPAYDSKGQKIGDVRRVFLDDATNEPAWATIWAKRYGDREAIVPLTGAKTSASGLALAVRGDLVLDAPTIDPDGEITEQDATQVSRHYGRPAQDDPAQERGARDPSRSDKAEMTSYEERLDVDAETVETGTARMHKSVTTEPVEATVPLRHEKVRVDRRPADHDHPDPEHEFAEENAEVTVHDQRPKVSKATVPTETVRLQTEATTDEQRVRGEVRREKIDIDDTLDEPGIDTRPVGKRRR